MLTGIIIIVSPFVLNGLTSLVVRLTSIQSTSLKRVVLAVLSLVGIVALSASTGSPVDPANVNADLTIIGETFVSFLMSHGSYDMLVKPAARFFKGAQA
jgi:hypothetical protein